MHELALWNIASEKGMKDIMLKKTFLLGNVTYMTLPITSNVKFKAIFLENYIEKRIYHFKVSSWKSILCLCWEVPTHLPLTIYIFHT